MIIVAGRFRFTQAAARKRTRRDTIRNIRRLFGAQDACLMTSALALRRLKQWQEAFRWSIDRRSGAYPSVLEVQLSIHFLLVHGHSTHL